MNFEEFGKVEYKHNTLFEVAFQAQFPDIVKILQEEPGDFQDILRKNGYPEYEAGIPILPHGGYRELEAAVSGEKIHRFSSEEKDWELSLKKDSIELSCSANYKNYTDFKEKFKDILEFFQKVYEPSYFSRIGLRYRNMVNKIFLPHIERDIKDFIPEHIFPILSTPQATDLKHLQKVYQFDDGDTKANVIYVLSEISGSFGKKELKDEESYIIDIDCFVEKNIEGINNVFARCDEFNRNVWNIFQWSITDALRQVIGESKT